MKNTDHGSKMANQNSDALIVRIKSVMGEQSTRSFAHGAGLSPSTLQSVLKGSSPTLDTLRAIARAGQVTVGWLASDEEAGPAKSETSYIGIPRLSARLAAGGGAWNEDDVEVLDHIPFTQDFLRKRLGRAKTGGLIILEARGDSMEPTISDGDLVMIDQHQKDLADGIFAFVLNGVALIKRIHPTLSGGIEVISDNPRYRTESLAGPEADGFQPIGKVVWCGHHFAR